MANDKKITQAIKPLIESEGFELIGVEIIQSGRKLLVRVYVDKPGGIIIDECARLSRRIGALFDAEGVIESQYLLEVSSPGLNRPLFNKEQIKAQLGNEISVQVKVPIEGRKNFKGMLQKIEGEAVCLLVDGKETVLPFDSIIKARLVPKIDFGSGKKS